VRSALRLKPGDEIAYVIEADRVVLLKARSAPLDDLFAVFDEWDGDADRKAYAKL
jgi:antitoxin PrlF